jgi:hypothetical protein
MLNADPRVMEFFPRLLSAHESDALVDRSRLILSSTVSDSAQRS